MMLKLANQREINRTIKKLGPKIAKKAIRKGIRASAKIFEKELKLRVPVDTGNLKKQIKIKAHKRSRKLIGVNVTTGLGGMQKGYYAGFIEYGRGPAGWHDKKIKKQPFIVPAYKAKRRAALRAATQTMRAETKKLL